MELIDLLGALLWSSFGFVVGYLLGRHNKEIVYLKTRIEERNHNDDRSD